MTYRQTVCWVWPSLSEWSCSSLCHARNESLHRAQYCLHNFWGNWSLKRPKYIHNIKFNISLTNNYLKKIRQITCRATKTKHKLVLKLNHNKNDEFGCVCTVWLDTCVSIHHMSIICVSLYVLTVRQRKRVMQAEIIRVIWMQRQTLGVTFPSQRCPGIKTIPATVMF